MPASSGTYKVTRSSTTTSTAITVVQIAVPANCAMEITRIECNQSTVTTSAATRVQLLRKSAAATVTSATPVPLSEGMQASKCVGGAALTGITATAEGTDSTVLWESGFNIVNGVLYLPPPEARFLIGPSEIIAIKFPTAPTSAGWITEVEFIEYAF